MEITVVMGVSRSIISVAASYYAVKAIDMTIAGSDAGHLSRTRETKDILHTRLYAHPLTSFILKRTSPHQSFFRIRDEVGFPGKARATTTTMARWYHGPSCNETQLSPVSKKEGIKCTAPVALSTAARWRKRMPVDVAMNGVSIKPSADLPIKSSFFGDGLPGNTKQTVKLVKAMRRAEMFIPGARTNRADRSKRQSNSVSRMSNGNGLVFRCAFL
jgi:hypothetical protein